MGVPPNHPNLVVISGKTNGLHPKKCCNYWKLVQAQCQNQKEVLVRRLMWKRPKRAVQCDRSPSSALGVVFSSPWFFKLHGFPSPRGRTCGGGIDKDSVRCGLQGDIHWWIKDGESSWNVVSERFPSSKDDKPISGVTIFADKPILNDYYWIHNQHMEVS
jgi:hypothetical protein